MSSPIISGAIAHRVPKILPHPGKDCSIAVSSPRVRSIPFQITAQVEFLKSSHCVVSASITKNGSHLDAAKATMKTATKVLGLATQAAKLGATGFKLISLVGVLV